MRGWYNGTNNQKSVGEIGYDKMGPTINNVGEN